MAQLLLRGTNQQVLMRGGGGVTLIMTSYLAGWWPRRVHPRELHGDGFASQAVPEFLSLSHFCKTRNTNYEHSQPAVS